MSGKGKNMHEALVDIKFEENLTWVACSKIVIEIIKYLAYQKQQIPYPFEQLKLLVNKKKTDVGGGVNTTNKSLSSARYHSKAAEAVETLESIFQNIEAEFMISSQGGCNGVEEVVVLFGPTPVTPKDVFRIQIPEIRRDFDFETPKPPSRKMMVHLLRCLLESESLHSIVSQPVNTTNTFIFFKRKSNPVLGTSDNFVAKSWFLPRENFKLPQKGRQAVLKIEYAVKEFVALEAESPLARPLVEISDCESTPVKDDHPINVLRSPLKKVENLRQSGLCGNEKVIKIPGFKLPNHIVFKAPKPLLDVPESSKLSNDLGEVKCMKNGAMSSMNRLSDDFEKLSFNPCPEKNASGCSSIVWFEARAPIKGFKDCVVNGISSITS
ncbi:MAD2L1-binding protein-like [Ischnura elegans]|uniref:MAD2L1-binding protein-like n=1 Tax=Ischnura elegans TaxID=197161 RepID=UPI001ED8736C|nr:MAD2L1-binding protein-like [Ischnura elegans]